MSLALTLISSAFASAGFRSVPAEPVAIGTNPQFFVDDYIIDNRFALNYENASKEMVVRVLHQPQKYDHNPLIEPAKIFKHHDASKPRASASYLTVIRDKPSGLFRLWYQLSTNTEDIRPFAKRAIAYAESEDGIDWRLPDVDPDGNPDAPDRNIVWRGAAGGNADSPFVLEIPDHASRDYKYVMLYLDPKGISVVGSHDGIRWDQSSTTTLIKMHSDTSNCIVYDETASDFVLYCRAKNIYRVKQGEVLDVGESRRIARMTSKVLWREWDSRPQNILIPDERDAAHALTAFYGMTAKVYAGIYWAFLQPFRWNTEIESELAFSRDGIDYQRLPDRPKLIELGKDGNWDDGFVLVAPWVEVGDEWWIYYTGFDGPHGIGENQRKGQWRTGSIGLAKVRREGFVSMRGPENGGVIVTRQLRWPGGQLLVNADARGGEITVRVTDGQRKVLPGFDYADCLPLKASGLRHEFKWKGGTLDRFANSIVRLEFLLQRADIYSFVASIKQE